MIAQHDAVHVVVGKTRVFQRRQTAQIAARATEISVAKRIGAERTNLATIERESVGDGFKSSIWHVFAAALTADVQLLGFATEVGRQRWRRRGIRR